MGDHQDSPASSKERSPSGESRSSDNEEYDNLPVSSVYHDIAFAMSICLAQFLSLASLAQTLVPLPIIGHYFGITDPGQGSWLTAAFGLTAGTFILPAGRLGDMYGLKRMYIIGFVFFATWSLIAGFSAYSTFVLLAFCRGMQGLGSAMVVPNSMALVGSTYFHPSQEKKKNLIYGFFAASAPTGFITGALFSTIFAQFVWWPWGFWVQAIALFGNAVLAYFVIPPDSVLQKHTDTAQAGEQELNEQSSPEANASSAEKARGEEMYTGTKVVFDWWGCLTGVTGMVLFNFAWNQAPVVTWRTPYIIATLVLAMAFLVAFYFVETMVASQPLVPFKHLSARSILTLAVLCFGWGSFGIWTYYFFQLQQLLRGYLPLTTVAQDAACIPSGLAASLVTAWLLSRIRVSTILLMATCFFLIGQTLLATVPLHQTFWLQTFFSLVIMPWGMDMSFPSGTALVSSGMPARYQGTASSLVDTVVNYSISLGLGFAGTIDKQIGGVGDITGAGLPGPSGQAGLYPGGDVQKNHALLRGYRASWYFAMGLDCLGILIACSFVLSDYLNSRRSKKADSETNESKTTPSKEPSGNGYSSDETTSKNGKVYYEKS